MSGTTADGEYPSWQPPELGLAWAVTAALLVVALLGGFIYWAIIVLPKPPAPTVIQITQAQLTALPKPAPPPPPPPPPKVVPPPKPLPMLAKPPPVASKIVIPTKPLPPVHHVIPRPIKRVEPAPPQPPTPTPPTPPVQAAPAPPTNGIPIYGSQLHEIIQSNQDVPPALAALGVSGTAVIRIVVAPDGHVVSASVVRSSGIPLIDQTALDHAMHAPLRAFNAEMPQTNEAFTIPIEIDASDSGN